MPDYRKMYYTLFNAITDALDEISNTRTENARAILEKAQQETEECYISSDEEDEERIAASLRSSQ